MDTHQLNQETQWQPSAGRKQYSQQNGNTGPSIILPSHPWPPELSGRTQSLQLYLGTQSSPQRTGSVSSVGHPQSTVRSWCDSFPVIMSRLVFKGVLVLSTYHWKPLKHAFYTYKMSFTDLSASCSN